MMKLDKESTIAIILCLVLLVAWPFLFQQPKPAQDVRETVNAETKPSSDSKPGTQENNPSPGKTETPDLSPGKTPETAGTQTETVEKGAEGKSADEGTIEEFKPNIPDKKIGNRVVEISIDPVGGAVRDIKLKESFKAVATENVVISRQCGPAALSVDLGRKFKLVGVECTDEQKDSLTVVRSFKDANTSFSMRQSWKLASDYFMDYEFEIINGEDAPPLLLKEIKVSAGELPPQNHLTGDPLRTESHTIDTCLASNDAFSSVYPEDKPFEKRQENAAKWVAVTNKYFACVLIPDTPFIDGNIMVSYLVPFKDPQGKAADYFVLQTSGLVKADTSDPLKIAPGKSFSMKFKYFAGPKEIEQLKQIKPKGAEIMHLGWKWIEGISQWLLVCLIWLKEFSGSYGMSIVLLTVIVKMIFWPITERANTSMKKMQKIQPMVQEIREKYKSDPQKMNTKVMQLYKEHKVNPLGGCFPILLQIPVFLALYNTLDGASELRHSSFLWATDLSMPDTIASISIPGFGLLGINPLILMMTATMVVQTKLTPTTMDPAQQKIMMLMPFVMLVMLYSLPSGLTLYWTISQSISIIQLLVSQKMSKMKEAREAGSHDNYKKLK